MQQEDTTSACPLPLSLSSHGHSCHGTTPTTTSPPLAALQSGRHQHHTPRPIALTRVTLAWWGGGPRLRDEERQDFRAPAAAQLPR